MEPKKKKKYQMVICIPTMKIIVSDIEEWNEDEKDEVQKIITKVLSEEKDNLQFEIKGDTTMISSQLLRQGVITLREVK